MRQHQEAKVKCPHCKATVWLSITDWGVESVCPICGEEIIVVKGD